MFRRRWPITSKILFALAVVLGALTFFLVRGYQQEAATSRPTGGSTAVVVATRDLTRGTPLASSMLSSASIPVAYAPPAAVTDPDDAVGRILTSDIKAGEILTASRVAAPHTGPIAALVPPGLRAMVIAAGVPSGSVGAGDRVDVFATYGGGHPHTELAASAVEILRVLSSAPETAGIGGSGATGVAAGEGLVVLVDTDAAERLAYARTFAQLSIAILGVDPATDPP